MSQFFLFKEWIISISILPLINFIVEKKKNDKVEGFFFLDWFLSNKKFSVRVVKYCQSVMSMYISSISIVIHLIILCWDRFRWNRWQFWHLLSMSMCEFELKMVQFAYRQSYDFVTSRHTLTFFYCFYRLLFVERSSEWISVDVNIRNLARS